jgi:hypothetical protein
MVHAYCGAEYLLHYSKADLLIFTFISPAVDIFPAFY